MARVRISVEDDHGQPLIPGAEQLAALQGPCDTLDALENALEEWRKKARPQREQTLLTQAQEEAIAKNGAVKCHGTYPLQVPTRHGTFDFKN